MTGTVHSAITPRLMRLRIPDNIEHQQVVPFHRDSSMATFHLGKVEISVKRYCIDIVHMFAFDLYTSLKLQKNHTSIQMKPKSTLTVVVSLPCCGCSSVRRVSRTVTYCSFPSARADAQLQLLFNISRAFNVDLPRFRRLRVGCNFKVMFINRKGL